MFSLCSTLEVQKMSVECKTNRALNIKTKNLKELGSFSQQKTGKVPACKHKYSKPTLLAAEMQVVNRKLDKTQTCIIWVGCEMNFKQDFQENPAVFLSSMPK